jgi:hypothetical protein
MHRFSSFLLTRLENVSLHPICWLGAQAEQSHPNSGHCIQSHHVPLYASVSKKAWPRLSRYQKIRSAAEFPLPLMHHVRAAGPLDSRARAKMGFRADRLHHAGGT